MPHPALRPWLGPMLAILLAVVQLGLLVHALDHGRGADEGCTLCLFAGHLGETPPVDPIAPGLIPPADPPPAFAAPVSRQADAYRPLARAPPHSIS